MPHVLYRLHISHNCVSALLPWQKVSVSCDDRCFLNRMGEYLEPPGNTRKLGTGTPFSAHKPFGAVGCVADTLSFQRQTETEACVDSDRQHFRGVLHHPLEGYTI